MQPRLRQASNRVLCPANVWGGRSLLLDSVIPHRPMMAVAHDRFKERSHGNFDSAILAGPKAAPPRIHTIFSADRSSVLTHTHLPIAGITQPGTSQPAKTSLTPHRLVGYCSHPTTREGGGE